MKYMYNDEFDVNFGTTMSYCAACERLFFVVTFEDWFWNTSTVTRLTLILVQQFHILQLVKEDRSCFELLFCNELQSFTELL